MYSYQICLFSKCGILTRYYKYIHLKRCYGIWMNDWFFLYASIKKLVAVKKIIKMCQRLLSLNICSSGNPPLIIGFKNSNKGGMWDFL